MPNWTDDNGYDHYLDELEISVGKSWAEYLKRKDRNQPLIDKVNSLNIDLENLFKQRNELETKIEELRRKIIKHQMSKSHG